MGKTTFIDAHVHGFLKPSDEKCFIRNIDALVKRGLERVVITALPYHDFEYQLKLSLSPDNIQSAISKDNHDETQLLTTWIERYGLQQIVVPFLDTRFLTEQIRKTIRSCKESGFMGVKGAFLPEPDRVLHIQGVPQALGISDDRYSHIQQEILSYASELNLPVLYHINLSHHFDWLARLLRRFPSLKISIPHLGYSLRRVMDILDSFENAFTDPSFLISLLRKNNPRYLDFINSYHTRILLGSDAIISHSIDEILSYADYFTHLSMPDHVKNAILRDNAHSFLSFPD